MPRRTPLYGKHIAAGARMVEFAGWELPVQYSGIIEEHNAVRNRCGMFDIGHMGLIEAPDISAVQKLTTNDASKLEKGQGQYSFMCNESGGVVDDLLVYRLEDVFLIIANGVNAEKVYERFKVQGAAKLCYDRKTMLAVQGPEALKILNRHCNKDLTLFKHRQIENCSMSEVSCIVSRSGYSGEDGAEIIIENMDAEKIWKALLDQGAMPCGLGSRDTLRIEASLPLYGHELSLEITPLDAGYFKTVSFEKGDFIGRSALLKQKEAGPQKKLIGFEVLDRAIPRQGYKIFEDGEEVGSVTSGTLGPTIGRPVGMGYVRKGEEGRWVGGEEGRLFVEIRGKKYPIKMVDMPFYRRKR